MPIDPIEIERYGETKEEKFWRIFGILAVGFAVVVSAYIEVKTGLMFENLVN